MINQPLSTTSYREAAQDNFNALKKAYASNDTDQKMSFWKLGNSFDTMIDFLDTLDESSAHEVAQIAVTQLNASLKHIEGGYDGAWFDDFGWWSVATGRALQKSFFKADAEQIQTILNQCWPRFTSNAPFVWQRRKPGEFDDDAPAIDGGVWNAYWEGTPNSYPGPKNGNPSDGKLIGIQNTVTNALYLMAAYRLGGTSREALTFLFKWFNEKEYSLWWVFDENTALVRERVGHFANGKRVPGFQENWAWTGDQGLILGCLREAMRRLSPGQQGQLINQAKQLLSGVRQHLVNSSGVVQSYTTTGSIPDDDVSDYQVGPGVFWRNALYLWKTNTDLRTFLSSQDYQAMVQASADAAANAPTNGQSIETLTNHTAVLVAATAMLQ
ncbi:MAG: hypothetical protein KME35_00490 [Aphanocapsa sp. GSE-SYN-MK-11-07L]|jgi:hypothetical protein|nr:hypothetical protein [Aphanocapsa sp. GSE-SYN-MK-11-07L]